MAFGIGEAPEARTVNGFFCMGCNSLLLSLFTHDYKTCECGNMVDGGNSYVRRGYTDPEAFKQVVEIYDWSPILVAAELGLSQQLIEFGEHPMLQDAGIKKLIEQERLVFTKDADIPEEGDQVMVEAFSDEELEAAAIKKQDRDRQAAAAIFQNLSIAGDDD